MLNKNPAVFAEVLRQVAAGRIAEGVYRHIGVIFQIAGPAESYTNKIIYCTGLCTEKLYLPLSNVISTRSSKYFIWSDVAKKIQIGLEKYQVM